MTEQEQFDNKQDSIRANVIAVCTQYPSAKEDYRKLLQLYWYYIDGLKNYVPFDVLEKLTQPESICRAFRKAVEEGTIDLKTTIEVVRRKQEKQYRTYYDPKKTRWVKEEIT